MERELEKIYAEKQRDLLDYLDKHNIKVLYGLDVIEDKSIKEKTKYYFVNEKDRTDFVEELGKDECYLYEITDFDNIHYAKAVPSLCGENGVEFGSIGSLMKFKQELKFIKLII